MLVHREAAHAVVREHHGRDARDVRKEAALGRFREQRRTVCGAVPRPGGPIVRIAGYSMLGDIKVLGPDSPARKYERFVR